MIAPSGYSGTPLAKKLGIKSGFNIRLINAPEHYLSLFTDLPTDICFIDQPGSKLNLIHFFTKSYDELSEMLPVLKEQITQNGIIWISWPKKASKIVTDITEDRIRNLALETELVDVKVCAVDETWSGLKLVIRLKDRKLV
jgi:hypothetical protein